MVKNKCKVRESDWVVDVSDAVVLATYEGTEVEEVPLTSSFNYELTKTKLKIRKVEFVKPDLPEKFGVLAEGAIVAVNPADITKLMNQRKVYEESRMNKSLLLNSYRAAEEASSPTSSEERIYFLTLTMKGWGFACKSASEGKAHLSMIQAQLRASHPRHYR